MIKRLASGVRTVVATTAVVCEICVIKCCRYPAIGRMTIVAGVATRNMGRVFSKCDGAVMAGRAGTDYIRVIHPISGRKQHGIVAILTEIAGQYMIKIFANSLRAIVTTEAITRNIGLIEVGRYPGHRRVAIVAGVAARNM